MTQDSLLHIKTSLIKEGLPVKYVKRLILELNDHESEIKSESFKDIETNGSKNRLGEPEELSLLVQDFYQNNSFFLRHPIFSYYILPILMYILVFLSIFALVVFFARSFDDKFDNIIYGLYAEVLANVFISFLTLVPLLATTIFYTHHVYRHLWKWQRLLFSVLSITCLHIILNITYKIPQSKEGEGMISVTLGSLNINHLPHIIIPFLILAFYSLLRQKYINSKIIT